MGALHEGHMSLVRQAAEENSDVFISIYVNPTQFGVTEDLSTYPRTWDEDLSALASLDKELESSGAGRITAIFAPTTQIMYPTLPPTSEINGLGSFISISPLGQILEGKSRPVFFRGVATVCMKLFNIVQPTRVYFGQKDIQQTAIIRRMIKDFHLPVEFRMGATMRESNGMAMSSRNVYLGDRRRKVGLALSQALRLAESQYLAGKTARSETQALAVKLLEDLSTAQEALDPSERALFKTDYISLADPDSLEEVSAIDAEKGAILSGAIIMQPLEVKRSSEKLGLGGDIGTVRLIDNIILQSSKSPSIMA
jgi:pantoate--beta-alanine ligase